MAETKSRFATEDDYSFFNNGTFSKILIRFNCLFEGKWNQRAPVLADGVQEAFKELIEMGYDLFLIEVPENDKILEWLDKTFDYPFLCNDYPSRYADLSDHWNTVSRNVDTSLLSEGCMSANRYFKFENNWNEIVEIIRENDKLAQVDIWSRHFDDIDWNQGKESNGLVDGEGNQVLGGSYIPVEKMNEKTTALLKTIAVPRTSEPKDYLFKPRNERWYISSIVWDVKEEIASRYGVVIEIEQCSLYYRGTWLTIKMKAEHGKYQWNEQSGILDKFCKDYGFDSRKELSFVFGYDLPWPEGQKQREEEDDRTDSFFDSMDD